MGPPFMDCQENPWATGQVLGLVLGTGDLSELLIGWCTMYGDHASHYGINAGVPKTLISYLLEWTAVVLLADMKDLPEVLKDILAMEISTEFIQ